MCRWNPDAGLQSVRYSKVILGEDENQVKPLGVFSAVIEGINQASAA